MRKSGVSMGEGNGNKASVLRSNGRLVEAFGKCSITFGFMKASLLHGALVSS
jgi:hypothetical protein